MEPDALNDTDRMELRVFGNDAHGHAVLVARLDNLGKGASGAAVQNIALMLGLAAPAAGSRRMREGPLYALEGIAPRIAPDAFVAPTAAVIGDV